MGEAHPLLQPDVLAAVERAGSEHRGRRWVSRGFTSLDDRASHPCGILRGVPFSVFAKLGADAREQFTAELAGLRLISRAAPVRVPVPVAGGLVDAGAGVLLLLYEALPERPPEAREPADWRSIGYTLAALHQTGHERFGLDGPRGFFGLLPQDNRPVPENRWAWFFRERRLRPMLRAAVDSGHLPPDLAAGVAAIAARLPGLVGQEPRPSLLHGDAQQNNFVSTETGAVVIDAAPSFGHPEGRPGPGRLLPAGAGRRARRLPGDPARRPGIRRPPRTVAAARLPRRRRGRRCHPLRPDLPGPPVRRDTAIPLAARRGTGRRRRPAGSGAPPTGRCCTCRSRRPARRPARPGWRRPVRGVIGGQALGLAQHVLLPGQVVETGVPPVRQLHVLSGLLVAPPPGPAALVLVNAQVRDRSSRLAQDPVRGGGAPPPHPGTRCAVLRGAVSAGQVPSEMCSTALP
jgi:fructosamine-3-kinase